MHKLRVGVLMGGKSIEREVSFNSGRTICDHLDTMRYEIIPIFQTHRGKLYILPWHFLHRGKINDFEHRLHNEATPISWDDVKKLIDFMYIATHGRYAEDGTLQGTLDVLGIAYLGSKVYASALCMDKSIQKQILIQHNIAVAKSITLTPEQIKTCDLHALVQELEKNNLYLPYVVKPNLEGSSLGISIVYDVSELIAALSYAMSIYSAKQQSVLIEEKLEGMEFSCITFTDYKTGNFMPLTPTEIVIEENTYFFDYEQKYMPGRAYKYTPPRCAPEIVHAIQETCVQVMQALDMTNLSRIDGFVTPDKHVVIVDPNTLSGMDPASFLFREAAELNMGHAHVINHLIETELYMLGIDNTSHFFNTAQEANQNKKIRVAVLMGGSSNEKEISLESGRNVTYKLSPHKYSVLPIFITHAMELYHLTQAQLVRHSTKEITALVQPTQKIAWADLPQHADFVFIALHGGLGENGSVQGFMEMLELPYNGSGVFTSALCMDKFKTAHFLAHAGFDVPCNTIVTKNDWEQSKDHCIEHIVQKFTFPLVIKPHDDGCSVLVYKAENKYELEHSIAKILTHNKTHILIEEFITGMELTVGVLGNENPYALPPSQAIAQKGILSIEEKFLPGAGENQTPAPLPQDALTLVKDTIVQVYKKLGCKGYARIDCFYQSAQESPTNTQRVVILEANTLPGLTPATCLFHQAAEIGIKPMDLIDHIITFGLEEHTQQAKVPPEQQESTTI